MVGAMFGRHGTITGRSQLVPLGEVGCRYKDHRFAVYNGKKGYESSEGGKDADE